MPLVSFGDLAQSNLLRQQGAAAKARIAQLSQELTQGRASDTARHVQGDLGPLLAVDSSLARLTGYEALTRETGLFAAAMQTGLSNIATLSLDAGNGLITASGTASTAHVRAASIAATSALGSVLTTLNARFGDRSLFAGEATASPAIGSFDTLMSALEGAVAGLTSAADVAQALDDWFAAPDGFGTFYQGGAPLSALPIAEGETVAITVTAADPALRDTLKSLAMASLISRGSFEATPGLAHDIARRAGEALLTGETDRSYLAAGLGAAEARIAEATTRNSAETTALQIARAGLVAVDPYDTATRLQDSEAQLQMVFTLTARLSRLNLTDYL